MAQLVAEKDSGLRQAMRTMGLMESSYWISWITFDLVFNTLLTLVIIASGARRPGLPSVALLSGLPCPGLQRSTWQAPPSLALARAGSLEWHAGCQIQPAAASRQSCKPQPLTAPFAPAPAIPPPPCTARRRHGPALQVLPEQ
jgi:hypothetical protein